MNFSALCFAESGASDNKCIETYHGAEPFSEVEMKNIRDYVVAVEPTPILALCLHSYSQLWMYPYGYATGALPQNVKEIVSIRCLIHKAHLGKIPGFCKISDLKKMP
jgi:hypothetical protein